MNDIKDMLDHEVAILSTISCFMYRSLRHIQNKLFLDIYLTDPDMCDERNVQTFLMGEYANWVN